MAKSQITNSKFQIPTNYKQHTNQHLTNQQLTINNKQILHPEPVEGQNPSNPLIRGKPLNL